jgi:lysophospholipase L1-like esterase
VVILGNSITRSTPDLSIGWNNDWGMAATKPEYDYVHLLTAKLKSVNPDVTVNTVPTGPFEVAYTTYDYTKDYAAMKALHPDLLIMRFGENIVQDSPDLVNFDAKYGALIAYFRDGNPDVKILAVGSFWGNPVVDKSMKKYSKFVTLTPLLNDISNQAFGQFPNYNVAVHPSDKGMQAIFDIIYEGLKNL